MEHNNNFSWVKYVSDVQFKLNSTKSNSNQKLMGHSPQDIVSDPNLEKKVRRNYAMKVRNKYLKLSKKKSGYPPLHVGSKVRILKVKGIYNKDYQKQFSDKIEEVQKIYPTPIPTYKCSGTNQKLYRNELALEGDSTDIPVYKIYDKRSITQTRLRSGTARQKETEYLVGQLNSDEKKRWLSHSEVKKLFENGLLYDTFE